MSTSKKPNLNTNRSIADNDNSITAYDEQNLSGIDLEFDNIGKIVSGEGGIKDLSSNNLPAIDLPSDRHHFNELDVVDKQWDLEIKDRQLEKDKELESIFSKINITDRFGSNNNSPNKEKGGSKKNMNISKYLNQVLY